MKFNADLLFIGAFFIMACPWVIAMFHVFKFARFPHHRAYMELRGFNPLRWKKVWVEAPQSDAKKFARAQCYRWMKICFATWLLGFALLVLLLFGLQSLGWLA